MKWGDRFEIDNLKIKLKEIEKKCYENNNWADKKKKKKKKKKDWKIKFMSLMVWLKK